MECFPLPESQSPHCKKHPDTASCYFLSQQPWMHLCEKCALNMALCGKKIERRLTDPERQRKLELESVVLELRAQTKLAEDRQAETTKKLSIIETEFLVEVESMLRFFDEEIEDWTRRRNEVYRVYSENMLDYFKALEDVRYRLSLSSIEIRNGLQNIENNFVALVHDISEEDFVGEIAQYRKSLDKVAQNQEKALDFDRQRDNFQRILEDLIVKTQAFKCSKLKIQQPTCTPPLSTRNHRLRPPQGCDSRKLDQSTTPIKKQDLNCLREEELKLRLKPSTPATPATAQVYPSAKGKGNERNLRTNSRPGQPKKEEVWEVPKGHRA